MTANFANAEFSDHALTEMRRPGIDKTFINQIISQPDSIRVVREGRVVLHKIIVAQDLQKALLYRVFIDNDRTPPVIVTVYRTSKITKYETLQ